MHIPVTNPKIFPLRTRGHALDIFHCSYDVVEHWGEPVLRNTFWRCYLPVTEGASIVSSRKTWPMRANEAIIIPPDCPVTGHADTPFTLFYAHFNCSIRLAESTPSTVTVSPSIRHDLDLTVTRQTESRFRMAMLSLVSSALTSLPEANISNFPIDPLTGRACRIMKEHIDRRLRNADLARLLNISEASLLRVFRATLGVSPGKEHLRIRLNHAAELLRMTGKSIEQIAEECGFWDRNHFTRVFTREWKTPPANYRKSATSL